MTIRFFVSVWVVRYLGPEQYGVYSYALSFVGLFTALTTLGLDSIVIRNLASEAWSEGEVLGTAFGLRIGAAVATMGVVAAIIFSVNDQWLTQLAVLIVSGRLVFKSADVFKLWFKSEIKSKYPVWVRNGVVTMDAAIKLVFIFLGLQVLAFVALILVRSTLKAAGTFLMYQMVSEHGRVEWSFRSGAARKMMQDAWPLILAGLSVGVYMKIDQVMLGQMVGESAVGVYATAVKISELWYIIPAAIAGSVFPKVVSSKENASTDVYRERMQAFYDTAALLSYIVIIPVVLSAGPLIRVLFGPEYAEAASILQVHIWAFLFVSLGTAQGKWLIAENYTRFKMLASLFGALVNVGLNLLLIPTYAGLGAAWATLLAQVVAGYVSLAFLKSLWPLLRQISLALISPLRIKSVIRRVRKVVNN
ncbi:PST family polysaccharide transporter [Salinibacter ruber]|uniref:PST family polysaccharide transporter n=2 Tax=Salinibacter ruber TaxID=146919 RepID=A0AAW5P7Z5_9BACT|nr:PST family polysaccharide transporter [Salinibacter ruber]